MQPSVVRLCEQLGYRTGEGLLLRTDFDQAIGAAHSLHAAADAAQVAACFGVWEQSFGSSSMRRFTPLVYIACSQSDEASQKLHRWVWSQGKVPRLLILQETKLALCSGFSYAPGNDWSAHVIWAPLETTANAKPPVILRDLTANRLRASVTWRDFTADRYASVDATLLRGLENLHKVLNAKRGEGLSANLINRLIGRLIYTYLLVDKGIIDIEDGVLAIHRSHTKSSDDKAEIAWDGFWAIQDGIDAIFNGGIFAIAKNERALITQAVLNTANGFIRRGESYDGKYVQQSLFSVDLSAIRIETLSAVYEKFLQTESATEAERDGVVYTRPFLVDFILNRVADSTTFADTTKVLDPTSGSGVFLVAAYRHIIESSLAQHGKRYLPVSDLQRILTSCLYGVEKSRSAAQVAAFSLYLNLLEYADPAEISRHIRSAAQGKVFPPLVDINIQVADFFAKERYFEDVTFDVAVGNPPWKSLKHVTVLWKDVEEFEVDHFEASEQIAWTMVRRYLAPNARLALVMPAKSFASPSAARFATSFGHQVDVDLLVNLSHWRRHLFQGAEAAAALLFAHNRRPQAASRTSIYSPPLWSQPFAPDAMWTLAVDRADLNSLPSSLAFATRESTFDAFALRPYDRHTKRQLQASYGGSKTSSFGQLMETMGLSIGRGIGPSETQLGPKDIASTKELEPQDLTNRRSVMLELPTKAPHLTDSMSAKFSPQYFRKFYGPRLILARSMQYCYCVEAGLAVNSSYNVLFYSDPAGGASAVSRKELLRRIGTYLMSDFAHYQFALFGKLWQIDQTRFERDDLAQIVVPSLKQLESFSGWDCSGDRALPILKRLGLESLATPLEDYVINRKDFENAKSQQSMNPPCESVPEGYLSMLQHVFRSTLADDNIVVSSRGISEAAASILISFGRVLPESSKKRLAPSHGFQFFDSAQLRPGPNAKSAIMIKPAERAYLTVERAYADGLQVINRLFLT